MSKVATVEQIIDLKPHPNADKLELATVLGWQVCVQKGLYKVGQKVVYVNIDSVLEERPEYEFLRDKKFRVKTIKLRKEISQGLCLPLPVLLNSHNEPFDPEIGLDVSGVVGAKHYEKPVPSALLGQAKGNFPGFLSKTDEENLKNYPHALKELLGKEIYITLKVDGSSGTYFLSPEGEFGLCSRNLQLKLDSPGAFQTVYNKYNLERVLTNIGFPVYIQGEVHGPGIQQNPLKKTDVEFNVFNVRTIEANNHWGYDSIKSLCETEGLPMVPTILTMVYSGEPVSFFQEIANAQKYGDAPAEGIVIRPKIPFRSEILKKSWSVKLINEEYKD